jgi:hypothetical protein
MPMPASGADLKYLLTSNLTLDATINPDFGQVEVDPAVVNLSAFETFFPERRPFFVEGSGTFGFGGFNCYFCSNVSSLSLFYSRRIGRTPQGRLPQGTTYSDLPDATTILGAGKVTGRTRSGFTVGVLDAVTAREHATALVNGTRQARRSSRSPIFVGRVKRLPQATSFGAIGTSVVAPPTTLLLRGSTHSEALPADWNALEGADVAAWVTSPSPTSGDALRSMAAELERALLRAPAARQWLPLRSLRSAPRSSAGWRLCRRQGRRQAALRVRGQLEDAGFEANDLAFNTRSDYAWMNTNLALSFARPTKWYRSYFVVLGSQREYNFDGDRTDTQFHAGASDSAELLGSTSSASGAPMSRMIACCAVVPSSSGRATGSSTPTSTPTAAGA